MVYQKLAQIGIAIATKYGSNLVKAEHQAYRAVGWKPHAAKTLVIVTNIGAGIKYIKDSSDLLDDGISQKSRNGPQTSQQNKTRFRQYSNSKRKYSRCFPYRRRK